MKILSIYLNIVAVPRENPWPFFGAGTLSLGKNSCIFDSHVKMVLGTIDVRPFLCQNLELSTHQKHCKK